MVYRDIKNAISLEQVDSSLSKNQALMRKLSGIYKSMVKLL